MNDDHKHDHAALTNKTHYGQVEANGANNENKKLCYHRGTAQRACQ